MTDIDRGRQRGRMTARVFRDYRDLVIGMLAADEAAVQHQFEEVQAEHDGCGMLLHVALDQLHEQRTTIERLQATIMRDREAHRRLREQILREERAA